MEPIVKSVLEHASVRNYDTSKKIPREQIETMINCARVSPTSMNGQTLTIIYIQNPNIRKRISELAFNQQHIIDCSDFFVFVMDFNKSNIALKKHGKTMKIQESVESILVGSVDIGIALGTAIVVAESMGLGTVPIGAVRNAPTELAEVLELPQNTFPIVGLCIGYIKGDKNPVKPKIPLDGYMLYDKYDSVTIEKNIHKYDKIMEKYFANRTELVATGKKDWSGSVAQVYNHVYYPSVYEALIKKGFSNDK